ncbi:MAG: acetylxylan esterase [Sedimentisphaerales bacterium]|nr:acetylxylan esterase [Sedimentisphaerales bacterium]
MGKNRKRMWIVKVWLLVFVGLVTTVRAEEGESLSVFGGKIQGQPASDMMKLYLLGEVDKAVEQWSKNYEEIKTGEQIAAYQLRLREKFLGALGDFPQRTPLNARVVSVVQREGYRVEKVIFESQPKFYVTGVLFLPDSAKYQRPYPAAVVPCGHALNAKAYESYQTMGALLALNGIAALVYDPIDQGERMQIVDEAGKYPFWGTRGHNMIGVGSVLLGRNTAWFEVWDGMRAVDYLQERKEIDVERIGCTGNSGGGTQTSYLMALEERIKAAAPSCYITSFDRLLHTIGCQDAEQNIFGQLEFGMGHADYLMMRAPMPIMICAATKDFFDIGGVWDSFRYAKRLYSRMGFSEQIDLIENDAPHNYGKLQREAATRWLSRWLRGVDEVINEPAIKLFTDEELQCTLQGQVMLLEGARSSYDINEEYEKRLATGRREYWAATPKAEALEKVRKIVDVRKLSDLPEPEVQNLGKVQGDGYHVEKLVIKPEKGIYLAALLFVPEKDNPDKLVLYLNEKGKADQAQADGEIVKLVKAGQVVLAVDLRGSGETKQNDQSYFKPHHGGDGQDVYTAYLLRRSYVGMRAEDVLVCARYAKQKFDSLPAGAITLVARGNVAVPALHAAALEPELFSSVALSDMLVSWSNVIKTHISKNQLVSMVHGALAVYDLGDLIASLPVGKVEIVNPLDAAGNPIQ